MKPQRHKAGFTVVLSEEERDTIAAALRLWESNLNTTATEQFVDIATGGGNHEELDPEQLSDLIAIFQFE